jgi:hypothetical protein
LDDPKQSVLRAEALRVVEDLADADDLDVLDMARALLVAVAGPVDELRVRQEAELAARSDLLDPVAIKQLEAYNKRRLSAFEEQTVCSILNVLTSLWQDGLRLSQEIQPPLLNPDAATFLRDKGAALTPMAVNRAVSAVRRARSRCKSHVGSQLVLETLLFDVREVLVCPR